MAKCIHCNEEVSTPFCGHCAQPNPPKKLKFGSMWYDFQSRIYGFDGMFPRTLIDLTIRPGIAAREYIRGNRVKHYGPVGYFFLMITLFLLIMSMMGIDFSEFSRVSSEALTGDRGNGPTIEVQRKMSNFVSDNIRTFSFLSIPSIVLMAWLFFRKSGYNFLEHAVIPFYILGHVYWLSILNLFLFKFGGTSTRLTIQLGVTILYFAFACSDFYTHNSKTKAFLKGLAVYLLGFSVFILIVMIAATIYMFTDPEIRELMKSGKQ
ncbi:MAG: DUF3667 domain-containing protein [Chryseolinea sp.]